MATTDTEARAEMSLPACDGCGHRLPVPAGAREWEGRCPGCGRRARVLLFPRAFAGNLDGAEGAPRAADDEAACFLHGESVAEASCASCGRFVCALCRVRAAGDDFCIECLERERLNAANPALAQQLTRYGFATVMLLLLPLNLALLAFATLWPLSPEEAFYMAIGVATITGVIAWPTALALLFKGTRPQPGTQDASGSLLTLALVVVFTVALIFALGILGTAAQRY